MNETHPDDQNNHSTLNETSVTNGEHPKETSNETSNPTPQENETKAVQNLNQETKVDEVKIDKIEEESKHQKEQEASIQEEEKEADKSSQPEAQIEADSGSPIVEKVKPSIAPSQNMYQVFMNAIAQRKKCSFDSFQEWEQQRTNTINVYRSICENILQKIQLRTAASVSGTEGLLKFFAERKAQEEHYYTSATKNLTPLGALFADKNLKDSSDWGLPKILREYDEYHLRQTKSSQNVALFIQNTIMKDILAGHKETMKKLLTFKQKIADSQKKIKDVNKKIEKKGTKYSNLINQLFNAEPNQKKDNQKDVYAKELSLVACAQKQTETYEGFGSVVAEFWTSAETEENLRFNSIKYALRAYTDKFSEVYGDAYGRPEILNKLLTNFDVPNEVKSLFSPTAMLTLDEIAHIKQARGLTDNKPLTKEQVVDYLRNYPFEPPKNKPLVLKEWEAQKECGTFKSLRPCAVIVTIDGNLILIDRSEDKVFKKAEVVVKFAQISHKEDASKKNPLILEILVITKGLILDSKKKYVFKFNKTDHIEEFLQYLQNYKS